MLFIFFAEFCYFSTQTADLLDVQYFSSKMPRGKSGGKYDRRMSFDDVKDERMLVMVDKLCVWMGGILGETLNRENLIQTIRYA